MDFEEKVSSQDPCHENNKSDPVLILHGENWHEGIIGIVAARIKDLFVTLTYSDDISEQASVFLDAKEFTNFRDDVVFVAIKNGRHDKVGYYLDSNRKPNDLKSYLPLHKLFDFIMEHFKLQY